MVTVSRFFIFNVLILNVIFFNGYGTPIKPSPLKIENHAITVNVIPAALSGIFAAFDPFHAVKMMILDQAREIEKNPKLTVAWGDTLDLRTLESRVKECYRFDANREIAFMFEILIHADQGSVASYTGLSVFHTKL